MPRTYLVISKEMGTTYTELVYATSREVAVEFIELLRPEATICAPLNSNQVEVALRAMGKDNIPSILALMDRKLKDAGKYQCPKCKKIEDGSGDPEHGTCQFCTAQIAATQE